MQKKEPNSLNQKLIDKIIRVAYGDAGLLDWIFIHLKSMSNQKVNSFLKDYRYTAQIVHKLKGREVPHHISERVKNITCGTNKKDSVFSRTAYMIFSFFENKAVPAAIMSIVLIIIISFFIIKEQSPAHKYSNTEIELAQKQLKQSLAIVGRTFQKAEKSFNKDVLQNQINKNLNRGYFLVNNILIGG